MKVLWLHNHYKVWGGESAAAEREARLLAAQPGVAVVQEAAHNSAIDAMGPLEQLALPFRNAWSLAAHRRVRALCREHQPDVVHAHNLWPLLSPSVFAAARAEGVPTVFTAHNYYLFCLNGVFFRNGKICTDCTGALPWRGVAHRCYRGIGGSSARLASTALHRLLRTFRRVDRILVPTEFARAQFLAAGFAPERVQAKWLSCEAWTTPIAAPVRPVEFVVACRLVPEKGVQVLIAAAQRSRLPWRLVIAGDGPERPRLQAMAHGLGHRVQFLGSISPNELQNCMARATAVLVPSIWYETFGLTVIEAFALGRPVVASRIGALQEIVDDAVGLRPAAGDIAAWTTALDGLAAEPDVAARMGRAARTRHEQHFTPAQDAARLLAVYAAIRRTAPTPAPPPARFAGALPTARSDRYDQSQP